MSDLLHSAMERVQVSMDEILANFKSEAKITVLVRTPGKPPADFCMTSDNLWEATAMLQRRMADAGYPVISSEPLALISQKTLGQLVDDRSGEYQMTVPKDKPSSMDLALFTWPTPIPNIPGIEFAARFVEKRLKKYVEEFGSTDPETGAVEFPGNGDEYVGELEEIIVGIRALTNSENQNG